MMMATDSKIISICPDLKRICYNNAVCQKTDEMIVSYSCDCWSIPVAMENPNRGVYAGTSCEYMATSFCYFDNHTYAAFISHTAFCTNGGTCRKRIPHEKRYAGYYQGIPYFDAFVHPGCHCSDEYAGEVRFLSI